MSSNQIERRASLESEHDFLLVSLRDLEAERSAGDIDPEDYSTLKSAYTARAAQVIREIEAERLGQTTSHGPSEAESSRWRRLAWLTGIGLFVVVSGFLLAQAAGERGVNDQLSGSIERTPREQVLDCQSMGPTQVEESLRCYQEVLDVDPNNVEALTYRGWALVLVVGSAQQNGDTDTADTLLPIAMNHLDRAVELDPTFPDVRAFRAVVFEAEGEGDKACAELAVLMSVNPPPFILELTAPLSQRLGC